ncbi:MAG: FAD:protein FMN transferase [Bacteroidetes bacterium]|nr:FAD:protein FMN transferase [Bacteroidota bacterium]
MKTVRVAVNAMATRFEFVLLGEDETLLQAAGEEALREITSLEKRLSYYSDTSELTRINRRAAYEPISLAPDLFSLLREAERFVKKTGGAFDPAIGPLLRCWGFVESSGSVPDDTALETATAISGFHHVHLDKHSNSVRFDHEGVEIDLGAIGKGYALDEAARIVKGHGITNALLHGGTSTVVGIGTSYDGKPWRIGIQDGDAVLGTIELENSSLSISARSGKFFTSGERSYTHILDPRTGHPTSEAAVSAIVSCTATRSDALSTAALVLGSAALELHDSETGVGVWRTADPSSVLVFDGLPAFDRNLSWS